MSSARLFEGGVQRLLRELEPDDDRMHVQFARVTRIEAKAEHRTSGEGAQSKYSHYYGFARSIDGDRSIVWFKMANHLGKSNGLFMGPVTHKPSADSPPHKNEIVFGKVVKSAKGKMFEWWVSEATPFHALYEILRHGTRQARSSRRLYEQLRLNHSLNATPDDLYLMVRLLVFADTQVIVRQLCSEEARERHPVEGQTRGFKIDFHPIEFAYFVAKLCMCPAIYEHVLRAVDICNSDLVDPDGVAEMRARYTESALREYCDSE